MPHSVPVADPLPATITVGLRKPPLSTDVVHRGVHNLCVAHTRVWTTVWETRGQKKVRETYCGTTDRATRNLSRAPVGGSRRGDSDGHEAGAQVNRITDDRLDRVRSDEVLEAFGRTGPRATPRRNAGPVDQIASLRVHPVRRGHPGATVAVATTSGSPEGVGGRPGQCQGRFAAPGAAPPWESPSPR